MPTLLPKLLAAALLLTLLGGTGDGPGRETRSVSGPGRSSQLWPSAFLLGAMAESLEKPASVLKQAKRLKAEESSSSSESRRAPVAARQKEPVDSSPSSSSRAKAPVAAAAAALAADTTGTTSSKDSNSANAGSGGAGDATGAGAGTGGTADPATGKEHEHAANPLDHIQPNVAPDFSSVDFSSLIELRESLHAQVDAEKQRLDGDTTLTPEERSRRIEQLDLKVKEIEVLEGMVRRALEVYQNVLKTSKDRNTTASDVKAESEKVIYDLQLTALKAKADMKAIAKDEQQREKEKEKAKDADAAAAAAAAAQGEKDKALAKEPDATLADDGKDSGKKPSKVGDDEDLDGDEEEGGAGKGGSAKPSKETATDQGAASSGTAANGTAAGNSTAKGAQNIAQDIAKDILKEVSGTADKIEDNLLDSHAFAEGTKAKGATIETVLKVEDAEQQKFEEEREDVSIPLFRPFAKGRGGIVSILIDAESNQYVLSRPNDVTYFYEDARLLNDVVLIFLFSFFMSFLCNFLRIPLFFGHLAAGVILGPSVWNMIKNLVQIHTLAQLGVAFILFVLGVEFNFAKLRKIWRVALFGSLALLVATCACFITIGRLLGSRFNEAMVVGASVFLSSTAVVIKFLSSEEYETAYGRPILGILVMQDILLGILLAVLPAFERSGFEVVEACLKIFGSLVLFMIVAFVVAWFPAHYGLRALKESGSKELYILGCVALCMTMMQFSAHLGISMEIGCFIAGLIISSRRSLGDYTLAIVEPVRDLFGCLFFAAIGLHGVHPSFLFREVFLLLLLTSGVIVFKFTLAVIVLVGLFRYPWRTASIVSIGLSQISEFVFVLASRAKGTSIISREVYYLLLGTTSLSMMIAPVLWTFLGPRHSIVKPRLPLFSSTPREHKSPPPNHVIDLQRLRSPSLIGDEGQRNRHFAGDSRDLEDS